MTNNSFNPYEILSSVGTKITKESSAEDIKKSYRKACIKTHPDRQQGKSDEEKKKAEETFKNVQKAYDILSDSDKKQRYDMFGIIDDGSSSSSQSSGFGGGFDPFEDLRSMFGGGFGGGGSRHQERIIPGEDLQVRIPVTLKDIYCGVTGKKIKIKRKVRCQNCHGSGGKTETCPHCHGTGMITDIQRSAFGVIQQQRPCPHCNATGKKIIEKCKTCGGSGFREEELVQEINFRPGVIDGEYISIRGCGNEAKKPGHPSGNLIAIAQWKFDTERFTVGGFDVLERINLPYEDCLLGTKYSLVLPDDRKIDVAIPMLSEPGKRLRLRGKGISGKDQYGRQVTGDYILEIHYIMPETLTDEEKQHLEEIKKLHTSAEETD